MGWEYSVMWAIQSLSLLGETFFDIFFAALTFLAEENFILAAVFAVYWCVDKRMGEYLLLSLFTSLSANGLLKDSFARPRPFQTPGWEKLRYVVIDNGLVDTASVSGSFSFPSGHSQCAGSFFTGLAVRLRKRWASWLAAALILGVMTSRVYLGVHFPGDVLAGAALGVGSALLCRWLLDRFYEKRLWFFAAAVLLLVPALFLSPSADTVKTFGVGLGGVLGLLWERRVSFTTDGCTWGRGAARICVGVAVVMGLRLGLKPVLPETMLFDGLRYGLVGLAATGLAPWIFVKCKL